MLLKNYICSISLALLIIIHACNVQAAPKVTFTYKNYKISGNNIDEIKRSVSENAPKNDNSYSFSPFTTYEISWDYKFEKSSNSCKIASVKTEIAITHHFPELANAKLLDAKTTDKWDEYFKTLKLHENGHANIGIEATTKIEDAIAKMELSESCSRLSFEANKIARKIINLYHKRNLGYANPSQRS
jgi:predicted secreted Zn-dependent protease